MAVELSKFSLWIYSSQKGDSLEPLRNQFLCKNTLADKSVVDDYKNRGLPFKWNPVDITEDFGRKILAFDAIVGNPPWGAELSKDTINIFSKRYKNSSYKLIDTFKFLLNVHLNSQKKITEELDLLFLVQLFLTLDVGM